MLRRNTKWISFYFNLEKLLGKATRKLTKSDNQPLEELLRGNPQIVAELGPVIGFLSIIYDTPLPKDYLGLSISMLDSEYYQADSINDSMQKCRTTPSPSPGYSPRHSANVSANFTDKSQVESPEASEMMEKLIVSTAEFNQDFLQKVLTQLDKSLFKARLQKLFGENYYRSQSPQFRKEIKPEEESKFNRKSKFGKQSRDTKNLVKPVFMISKRAIRLMARFKAYHAIASLVSRQYFFCGEDCEFVAGEQLNLATFFELVRDKPHFIKIARKVIEAYKGEEMLKEIITYTRWNKELRVAIASIYLSELPDMVNAKDLIFAIQFDLLPIALKIEKLQVEVSKDKERELGKVLVFALKRPGYLAEKLHLVKVLFHHLNYEAAKELVTLDLRFSISENPIKDAVHYFEVLSLIEKGFSALKIKAEDKARHLEELILQFGKDLDDSLLKPLMLSRDYEGRTTIKVIHELHLVTFFPKLEPIIDELWRSPHERKGSLFQASTSYTLCYRTSLRHPKPLNPFLWTPSSKAKNHSLRFQIWKTSPMVRFFIESFYLFLITLFMQTTLVEIQFLVKDLQENQYPRLDSTTDLPTEIAVLGQITYQVELMMTWFLYLEYCLIFLSTLLLQPLFEFIGQLPLKKSFDFCKMTYLLDIIAVTALSFFFNRTYLILDKTTQDDGSLEFQRELAQLFRNSYLAHLDLFDVLLGVGIMSKWLRVLLIFRGSQFLGPFLKVIQKLVKNMATFFLLYLIILISFASVGNLAFFYSDSYDNLFDAIITLFSSSIGGFNFKILNSLFGKLFLCVFLIISLIMLLNLLIAILSATYSYYETKARGLYLHEVLGLWENAQFAGNRGFLVMGSFPFHAIVVPFMPAFLCLRERGRVKMDRFLQNLQFISALFLHLIIFAIVSACSLPLGYLKLVLHSILSVTRFRGGAYGHRFGLMCLFIFLGPFILLGRFFLDFAFMIYDDFQLTVSRDDDGLKPLTLKSEVLFMMMEILQEKVNSKKPYLPVHTRDILLQIRSRLGIRLTYQDIANMAHIFRQKQQNDDLLKFMETNQNSSQLELFSQIKEFLLQNSVRLGNNTYKIYPLILKKVIQEFLDKRRQDAKRVLRTLTMHRGSLGGKNTMKVSPHIKLVPAKPRISLTEGMSDLSNLSILAPVPLEDIREERRGQVSYFSSEIQEERFNTENLEENELITLPQLVISHFGLIEAMLKREEDSGEGEGELSHKISRMESALIRVISTRPGNGSPFNMIDR